VSSVYADASDDWLSEGGCDEEECQSVEVYDWRDSFFRAVKTLEKQITVSYQTYVHTIDYKMEYLRTLSSTSGLNGSIGARLDALRVAILQPPSINRWSFPLIPSPHHSSSSKEINELLRCHNTLRKLHIELSGEAYDSHHPDWEEEKACALENIQPAAPNLKDLSFSNDFTISPKVWANWASFPWAKLHSLSLFSQELINQFGLYLQDGSLPSLQTLHLRGNGTIPTLPQFILSTKVAHLLLQFHLPDALIHYLSFSAENAQNLQSLCIYGTEDRFQLSVSQVKFLSACPQLSWLNLDLERDYLRYDSEVPPSSEYLNALAALRPLQHLNFFVPTPENALKLLDEREAIGIYVFLQSRKQGCSFLSIDFSWECDYSRASLTVWNWGESRVLMDVRYAKRPRRLEIWDSSHVEIVEECETRWRKWWYRTIPSRRFIGENFEGNGTHG
jgi:hypothetical protein